MMTISAMTRVKVSLHLQNKNVVLILIITISKHKNTLQDMSSHLPFSKVTGIAASQT
jgi:hypothetical protein